MARRFQPPQLGRQVSAIRGLSFHAVWDYYSLAWGDVALPPRYEYSLSRERVIGAISPRPILDGSYASPVNGGGGTKRTCLLIETGRTIREMEITLHDDEIQMWIQNLGRNGWRIKWISTEEEFFVNRFLLLENLAKTEGGIHYYYFFFFREKIKYGNVKSR